MDALRIWLGRRMNDNIACICCASFAVVNKIFSSGEKFHFALIIDGDFNVRWKCQVGERLEGQIKLCDSLSSKVISLRHDLSCHEFLLC